MGHLNNIVNLGKIASKAISNKIKDKNKRSHPNIGQTQNEPMQSEPQPPAMEFSRLITLPEAELKMRFELQEFSDDDLNIILFLQANKENPQFKELIVRYELGEFSLQDFYQKLSIL